MEAEDIKLIEPFYEDFKESGIRLNVGKLSEAYIEAINQIAELKEQLEVKNDPVKALQNDIDLLRKELKEWKH